MDKSTEQRCNCAHAWRGSLSVNNHAVLLFSKGYVSEGKTLLRESLDLIKIGCLHSSGVPSSAEDLFTSAEDVSSRIQRSFHLISNLPEEFGAAPSSFIGQVQVLNTTGCFTAMPNSILSPDLRRQVFSLVHIEASESHCLDLEIHSAFILYNLSIAFLLEDLWNLGECSHKTLSSSLSLLHTSHMLLSRRLEKHPSVPSDDVVCTNLLALEKICALLHILGREEEASQAASAVHRMKDYIDYLRLIFKSPNSYAPAA